MSLADRINKRKQNLKKNTKINIQLSYKKILSLILIIFLFMWYMFNKSINNISNIEIPTWNYTIKSWDTVYSIPKIFNLKFTSLDNIKYKIWAKRNTFQEFKLQKWNYNIPETNLKGLFSWNSYLNNPSIKEIEITILPWYNIFDIDELLTIKQIIKPWEFIKVAENIPDYIKKRYNFIDNNTKTLEWMCYPDTYRLYNNPEIKEVLIKCLDNFEKKINPSNISNFKDILNLASILQKEERNPDNKKIVAWILQKRIDEGWGIGADATICYWWRKTHSECEDFVNNYYWWNVSIWELSDKSYDTRAFIWLPITPIWNVTDDTIDAVVNLEQTKYFFYLHWSDGQIHYAETLQGHVNNKKFL